VYNYGFPSNKVNPTQDIVGAANFSNGVGSYFSTTANYGPYGGTFGDGYSGCCGNIYYLDNLQTGFIVITLVTQTTKYIVCSSSNFNTFQTGSFTLPSDFGSLTSIESFGAGGYLGGGGGYSKTLGSSVTTSMVADSTVVYYQVGANATFISSCCSSSPGPVYPSWINIGTNSAPTSVTSGVLANGGQGYLYGSYTSVAGAVTTGAVGDTKYGGGASGTDNISNSNGKSGGGGGGPLGAGAAGGNAYAGAGAGGGGGASNGGNAGSAGTLTTGGAGGTITGGTGGNGATVLIAATAGTNGGGGGGGFSNTRHGGAGGVLTIADNVYGVVGGAGANNINTTGGGGHNFADTTYQVSRGMVVFTYTPPPTPTLVALTGSSSTASAGTLTPVPSLFQALSSGSATASAGTLTPVPSLFQALSSGSATASAGTLSPSQTLTQALSDASASASSGTLTNSQALEIALTGVSVKGQTSSFPAFSEMVGAEAAAGIGVLGYVNTGWQPINTVGGSTTWININTQQA
jgi:hypothetical protein